MGVILIVVPVPAYLLVRWRKRKNKETAAIQVRGAAGVAWLLRTPRLPQRAAHHVVF